jgi:sugar-specific transcriptional regulator TrmB
LGNSSEFIDILKRLGLTLNEARVFCTLCAVGKSTAKSISKTSGIAREVVYQVLPSLQKKGLVEEMVTSPKSFRALSMENAFETMLRRRTLENAELKKNAMKTLENWQSADTSNEEPYIVVLPPREDDAHWKEAWYKAQETADMIMPLSKFLQWPHFYAEAALDMAMKKKLKLRIITEAETQKILQTPPEGFSSSLVEKFGHANFKFMTVLPRVELTIFDRKKCFVGTNRAKQIKDMTWLLTDNPFIAEMACTYFEAVWSHPTRLAELFAW